MSAATESNFTPSAIEPALSPGRITRRPFRLRVNRVIVGPLVFVLGIAAGVVGDRLIPRRPKIVSSMLPANAQLLKPGPWGRLAKIPLTISAPEELLPIRSLEAAGTHWFFGSFSLADFAKLLDAAEVTADQRESLMASAVVREDPKGLEVTPANGVLLALAPDARLKIYQTLVPFRENRSQLTSIAASSLDERFQTNGVSSETVAIFRQLSCEQGGQILFSGLSCVLANTGNYKEKVRLMKALTLQKTFLLRFYVNEHTDIKALTSYWGKAVWSSDIEVILASLSRVPGGIWSSALHLLPPVSGAQLYNYPVIREDPRAGGSAVRDCHWTSFNFFRDQPEPKFSDIAYIRETLRDNYSPVQADPRYGDIVFFAKPGGDIVHSAVYLADDVVYTKNGDTFVHPWMLSTIPDLQEFYSAQLQPGEKLVVSYYRNKYN